MHRSSWLRGINLSADGGAGDRGAASGKSEEKKEDQEVQFSTEQQVKLNQIAADERRRGEAKGKKDAQVEFLAKFGVTTLEELEAKLNPPQPPAGKDKDDDALAKRDAEWRAKLEAEQAERAKLILTFQEKEKRAVLVDAAAKNRAIDPAIVAELVAKDLDFNDKGEVFVRGESGPRLNSKGEPLTPAEHVAAFLAERPYLVQASGTQGGGSKESATGSTDPMKKALEDKNAGAILGAALKQALGSK